MTLHFLLHFWHGLSPGLEDHPTSSLLAPCLWDNKRMYWDPFLTTVFNDSVPTFIHDLLLPFGNSTLLWKSTIFIRKTHCKWQFSIAMFVYQRVLPNCWIVPLKTSIACASHEKSRYLHWPYGQVHQGMCINLAIIDQLINPTQSPNLMVNSPFSQWCFQWFSKTSTGGFIILVQLPKINNKNTTKPRWSNCLASQRLPLPRQVGDPGCFWPPAAQLVQRHWPPPGTAALAEGFHDVERKRSKGIPCAVTLWTWNKIYRKESNVPIRSFVYLFIHL